MALDFRLIDFGVATSPMPGEAESGDRHLVSDVKEGARVVVVDALGHGPEAADAARIATDTAARCAGEPARVLFERCHQRLAGTRGVVMSAATFGRGALTWLGVGNVSGVLVRPQLGDASRLEWLLVRPGIVGARLPCLRSTFHRVARGNTLYIATDGVSLESAYLLESGAPAQRIADGILHRYATGVDDALIVVARYVADGR